VPGLDERREDIPPLVRHLLAAAGRDHPVVASRYFEKDGKPLEMASVEPALIEALLRHNYTLQLRELNRLLWVALTTGRDAVVRLTPELRAELCGNAEPRSEGEQAAEPAVRPQPPSS